MTTPTNTIGVQTPWYRERWPWILMAGPFVVVVASIYTAWLAYSTSDGLVTDNYYKEGLAVNKTIALSEAAEALGIEARARFTAEGVKVALMAAADSNFPLPKAIQLTLSHPTRAGLDQKATLVLEDGGYVGLFRVPASGHWIALIEDVAGTWRLVGNVMLPAQGEIVIGGLAAAQVSKGK